MSGRHDGSGRSGRTPLDRGQSHVVGVVLLLGLTAIAMGGLTAAVGTIVDEQTANADATRVASDMGNALRPVETTGHREGSVTFGSGRLSVKDRELRVMNDSGTIETVETDALVFEAGDRRVASVAGAVARGREGNAWLVDDPPITSGPDVLVVGAARLNGTGGVGGTDGVTTTLETNVSHDRRSLGDGEYRIAVETATPGPFERYAEERGVSSTIGDPDDDGVPSVILDYGDRTRTYLVIHDMRLEVGHG
ncbi:DUF7289 family protein [Halomicrobium salinisoli]|uniref:DUF7289 family protein n=1 Tax=Halomicrobium salinisoli TaxID=2878391 RepID=UPI001CF03E93|nr:type IV pilin [Halomicrobium salinisoli]